MWEALRAPFRAGAARPKQYLVILGTFGLGVGANTAILNVTTTVLLQPPPYERADRLVRVWEANQSLALPRFEVSPGTFTAWEATARSVAALSARFVGGAPAVLRPRDGEPLTASVAAVTTNFFDTLRVKPLRGSTADFAHLAAAADPVVIISETVWRNLFGSDDAVVGRTVLVNDRPCVVAAVMPTDRALLRDIDIWTPLVVRASIGPRERETRYLEVFGRLQEGVSISSAEVELRAVSDRLATEYPRSNAGWQPVIIGMHDATVERVRPALLALQLAVTFVLVITGANIGNILLATALARRHEVAIKRALGATTVRLMRQMLLEAAVLSLAGGMVGLLVAVCALRALALVYGAELAFLQHALVFRPPLILPSLLVSLTVGVPAGLVPAWLVSRGTVAGDLKGGFSHGLKPSSALSLRGALVVLEVAFTLALLSSCVAAVDVFMRLVNADPGFRAGKVVVAQMRYAGLRFRDPATRAAEAGNLIEGLKAMPSVRSAAVIDYPPLVGRSLTEFVSALPATDPRGRLIGAAMVHGISPSYFDVMGIKLTGGREFSADDRLGAPAVAIVNVTLGRRLWPGIDPLGQNIYLLDGAKRVVGVAADVRFGGLADAAPLEVYVPYSQRPLPFFTALAAMDGNRASAAASVRHAVSAGGAVTVSVVSTMEALLARTLVEPRLYTVLLSLIAGIALVLSAVGVYGVITTIVAERTRDIGIRLALGAGVGTIRRTVVRSGLRPVAVGIAVGWVLTFILSKLLSASLMGASHIGPSRVAVASVVLALVAYATVLAPARSCMRIDPLKVLRQE